jgi:hypothetical protein
MPQALRSLRELNVARNAIADVGAALARNTALKAINLADNRLGSFAQAAALSPLPRLTQVRTSLGACLHSPAHELRVVKQAVQSAPFNSILNFDRQCGESSTC